MDQSVPELLVAGRKLELAGRVVDLGSETLHDSEGQMIELRPQAWQVLRYLVLHAGRIVTKEELLAAVWPGLVVTDDSLVQAIGDVRRSLGDAGHRVVKTVPRRGYVLVADALKSTATPHAPALELPRPDRAVLRPPVVAATRAAAALAVVVALLAVAALWLHSAWRGADPKASAAAGRPSIAVLAFTEPERTSDGLMLARGVAEDLVTELARSSELRVVSHQSSFQFVGGTTPLDEIGQRLRSRYIVDGSVRREEEQLRIGIELLDSVDGQIVWTSSQLVERERWPALRRVLVGRIAGILQSNVVRSEGQRALASSPKTLDVVVLTEHGKAAMQRYSAQGVRSARGFYERAIAIDPGHAPVRVLLGIANTVDVGLQLTGEWPPARIGEVVAQIQQAIALDPGSALAYVALSQAQALARDYDAALVAAKHCSELSPNQADCFFILGKAQLELGDVASATRNLAEAMDRNPLAPAYLPAFYASALWGNGQLNDAVHVADDCLAKAPDFWRCRQDRLAALVELGRLDDARAEAARLLAQMPGMTTDLFVIAFADNAAALRGRRAVAARAAGIPPGSIGPQTFTQPAGNSR